MSKKPVSQSRAALVGAAFLMATSAIGPGFLTQTTLFTQQLGASFGFAILISILLDVGAQLNIWRGLAAADLRGQDMAERLRPGLGKALAGLIVAGGLAFNIGNLAGCGLGLEALTGLPVAWGAAGSAALAAFIFWQKEAGRAIDFLAKWLGLAMLGLTFWVVFEARPPLGEAFFRSFWPSKIDAAAILTLVGGTVGGYIAFAGAHRLLEAGWGGKSRLEEVDRAAVRGIVLTGAMRILLFLAALGVVAGGAVLSEKNPAASVFEISAGSLGLRFFGAVMWAAAITSVVGSAYTSVSFLQGFGPFFERNRAFLTISFIAVSAFVFLIFGRPVQILVFAGALNGLILPIGLAVVLVGATRKKIVGDDYRHPRWMLAAGWAVVAAMAFLAAKGVFQFF